VGAGRAWLLLGRCLSLRERFVEATECFAACEARLAVDGPSEELLDSLGGRLAGAFFLGEYAEALALGERQLAMAEVAGSLAHVGAAHLALSGVCNHLPGLGERALEHAQQAKAVGRRSGQLRLMSFADVVVGHALRRVGRLDEALAAYRAGLSGPASALPPSAWINALYGIGQAWVARSDAAAAQQHFEEALAMARRHPAVTRARVCEVARELVHLHIAQRALEPARAVLANYVDTALAFDAPPHLRSALLAAACWMQAAGQPGIAAAWAAPLAAGRDRLTDDERARLGTLLARLPATLTAAPGPGQTPAAAPDTNALREWLRHAQAALREAPARPEPA
jgi:tetratricopeptide (TPR) repeat protein